MVPWKFVLALYRPLGLARVEKLNQINVLLKDFATVNESRNLKSRIQKVKDDKVEGILSIIQDDKQTSTSVAIRQQKKIFRVSRLKKEECCIEYCTAVMWKSL